MRTTRKIWTAMAVAVAGLGIPLSGWPEAAAPAVPTPQPVATGVWLISGGILPNHEPDGNSVIFDAPAGLIVMDTGRHDWHARAILALARERKRDIVAIVNSHWHLDHVSGNPALRAAYPGLRVYASNAIDGALSGFLPASVKDSAPYLDDPTVPEETRADMRLDLATIQRGSELRPDVVINSSTVLSLGGRQFHIHLAPNAATNGDVWLFDPRSGVAALGDLVTLPAPFLDTACPEGWKSALAKVSAAPFRIAIPGHGAPMQRPQFLLYRRSFESFIDCSRSDRPKESCAADWAQAVRPLLSADPLEMRRAQSMSVYYVELLRANSGRSKYCEARSDPKRDG
ncbi:MAG TPA: MBL fold metallo-hydrolase [Steroidobacteraceae bacterium]|nr:MBL fold metallo-hydrolase [Steroidobacteraceae bacterium]